MQRREALKRIGALTGSVAAGIALGALESGCRLHPEAGYVPRALGDEQFARLKTFVDLIIPPTDTPGAADVGVAGFIDELLADIEAPADAKRVLDAFDNLPGEKIDVAGLDARAFDVTAGSGLPDDDAAWTWRRLKEWTIVGYYTSEEGAALELHVMPYGPYRGDIPVTKTWA